MSTKKLRLLLPVLNCLIAASLWGVMWYPLRLLEQMGMSGLWASVVIYIAALLPVLPGFWSHRHIFMQQRFNMVMITIAAGWANLGFILAVLEGNVVRVLLLFYLSPIWTVLLGRLLLNEHLSVRAWMSVVIALSGAMVMLWQPGSGIPVPAGASDLMAVSAGFAFAVMNVFVRKAGDIPIVLKMGSSSIGVVLLSVTGILVMQPMPPVLSPEALVLAILLGSIGVIIMTYTAQFGVTHLPVHQSAVIFLFEIVAGALSAALLTNEIVTVREWAGGILVIMAALLTAMDTLQDGLSSSSGSKQGLT